MYKEIAANKRRTIVIMIAFLGVMAGLAWLFGRVFFTPTITYYVLAGATIYAVISYFTADKIALAVNGAQEVDKASAPRLYRIVENIAITDGLPTPKVYIMDDPAPNAFATGRDPQHSVVCATSGLLDIMSDTELEGVIAHEMGHVKNYDIRVMMIAFAMVTAISLLADIVRHYLWFGGGRRDDRRDDSGSVLMLIGLVAAIIAPVVALLLQLAISRRREYLADATGALTTRYPEGLASALEKIRDRGSVLRRQNTATAHLFFTNPLSAKNFAAAFSTHPPIEDRINKLREMKL